MAQILVRNLSDEVVARLKWRAEARGVSLEVEVLEILQKAADEPLPVEMTVRKAGTNLKR